MGRMAGNRRRVVMPDLYIGWCPRRLSLKLGGRMPRTKLCGQMKVADVRLAGLRVHPLHSINGYGSYNSNSAGNRAELKIETGFGSPGSCSQISGWNRVQPFNHGVS